MKEIFKYWLKWNLITGATGITFLETCPGYVGFISGQYWSKDNKRKERS